MRHITSSMKKYPDSENLLAIQALICSRTGKKDESEEIAEYLVTQRKKPVADEIALNTMQILLKNIEIFLEKPSRGFRCHFPRNVSRICEALARPREGRGLAASLGIIQRHD